MPENTDSDSDQIPRRILSIVPIDGKSPLFKALSKKSLYTWPISVYQSVLRDLNELLAACVSLKFVSESGYIDHIALDVKNERAERLAVRTMSLEDITELLSQKVELLERRNQRWTDSEEDFKSRKDTATQALELRLQDDFTRLDDEWNSADAKKKFEREFPELTALRQRAHADPALKDELAAKELAAEKRRDDAYFAAAEKVRRGFERDLNELEKQFDAEWSEMQKAKAVEIRRINRVIENLQIHRETLEQDDPFCRSRNRAQSRSKGSAIPPLRPR